MGGEGGTEGVTGDSQGSSKTFDSATGSPPNQTITCFLLSSKNRNPGGNRRWHWALLNDRWRCLDRRRWLISAFNTLISIADFSLVVNRDVIHGVPFIHAHAVAAPRFSWSQRSFRDVQWVHKWCAPLPALCFWLLFSNTTGDNAGVWWCNYWLARHYSCCSQLTRTHKPGELLPDFLPCSCRRKSH